MSKAKKRIVGKSFKYYEDGKRKHWGKVLDYMPKGSGDVFAVYCGYNPIGYRVWYEDADSLMEWIEQGLIKQP